MTHPAFDQAAFRGRNDNGGEAAPPTGATWIANTNINWSQLRDVNFRVRFLIQNTNNKSGNNFDFQLFFSRNGGTYTAVTATSGAVRTFDSTNLTDGADTTQQLGSGSFVTDNNGVEDVSGVVNSVTWSGNQEWEMEFCIRIRSAVANPGDTIELRVYNVSGPTALDAYSQTPLIRVQSPPQTQAQPLYLEGSVGAVISDSQPLYAGAQAAQTDSQPLYARGRAAEVAATPIYFNAQAVDTVGQSIYLAGVDTRTAAQAAYSRGQEVVIAAAPLYLVATGAQTGAQALYTRGQATETASQPLYLAAAVVEVAATPLYLAGVAAEIAAQALYSRGQETLSAAQPLYLAAAESKIAATPLYAQGEASQAASTPLYLAAAVVEVDSTPLYLAAEEIRTAAQPVYLAGQAAQTAAQPIYFAGQETQAAAQVVYLAGRDSQVAAQPLYLTAQGNQYFYDTFTEASDTQLVSHTPDIGTSWTQEAKTATGNAVVVAASDTVHMDANETTVHAVYSAQAAPTQNEYDVEVTFAQIYTGTGNRLCGIFARYTSTADAGYAFEADFGGSPSIRLLKKVGDSTTTLDVDLTIGVNAGDRLKLEIRNAAKKCYIDNGGGYVEVLSSTDDTITVSGETGIYWGNLYRNFHIRTEIELDEFLVTLAAAQSISDSQPLYLAATAATTASQPLYLAAQESAIAATPLYFTAQATEAAAQGVYLAAQESQVAAAPVFLDAQAVQIAAQVIFLAAQGSKIAAQPLFFEAIGIVVAAQSLYWQGTDVLVVDQAAYLAGGVFPFSDDFTGIDFDPWAANKWLTEAG